MAKTPQDFVQGGLGRAQSAGWLRPYLDFVGIGHGILHGYAARFLQLCQLGGPSFHSYAQLLTELIYTEKYDQGPVLACFILGSLIQPFVQQAWLVCVCIHVSEWG